MTMKRTQTGFQKKKRDTLFNSTNTIENNKRTERLLAAIIATTKLSAVYNALRTSAKSWTDFSEICTKGDPSPAVWDIVIGIAVVVVEPSEGTVR